MAIINLIKSLLSIFFEGTDPVKLDLVPELVRSEIRNIKD